MKFNLKGGSKLNLKHIHLSDKKKKEMKFNLKEGSKLIIKEISFVTKEKKRNEI